MFAVFPDFKTILVIENTIVAGLVVYGMGVGFLIWSGTPSGKRLACQYLMIRLGVCFLASVIMVALASRLPPRMLAFIVAGEVFTSVGNAIAFLIWWLYFAYSKRVQNTYGGHRGPQSLWLNAVEAFGAVGHGASRRRRRTHAAKL
jgi:hypothetical protein